MNNLLFLAPFPTIHNIKDGMINRVDAIDNTVKQHERSYLDVSLRKNWKKNIRQEGKANIYNLNIIRHFFAVFKLLKQANIIYTHSIHGFTYLWLFIPLLKAKIILDAHGVVPEEMKYFSKYKLRYIYYEMLEKMVIKKTSSLICVTHVMRSHFQRKYPKFKGDYYIYNIFPKNITAGNSSKNSGSDQINVIYSGGISPWQNIDMMLQLISQNITPNIRYTILTSNTAYIKNKLQHYGIKPEDVVIDSVLPDELAVYYEKADYAFILRDDNIVNRVACPTKLVEYLNYGIIPIVLCPNIGDFYDYGYKYLPKEKFNKELSKPNTQDYLANIEIVKKMQATNNNLDIQQLFFS